MNEVEAVKSPEKSPDVGAAGDPGLPKMVTPLPTLRVDELRDEDGHSSSGTYGSEDDGVSHGEGSDGDARPQPEFVPPDEDLKNRIIKQVEFYFSDANILKDAFLLKHVRRNKQGYVSLKLITSFKKVKSLTKDHRVSAYSLRQSDKLEVNEDGTKVRRRDPLPEYDETIPSRTVVAVNLPMENPTIEGVADLFSPCGEIALIRILRPGKGVPQDVKKHIQKHPEIGQTVCAVVEFEQHESAKKACDQMTNMEDWRKGLRVVLLSVKQEKKDNKKKKNERGGKTEGSGDGGHVADKEDEGKEDAKRKKKKNGRKSNARVDEIQRSGSPYYSSGSDADNVETSPPVATAAKRAECLVTSGDERPRANSLDPYTELGGRQRTDSFEKQKGAGSGGGGGGRRKSDHMQRSSLSPGPGAAGEGGSNRLSPRSTPGNSPRASPRGSPTSRKKLPHGRSPLAKDLSPSMSPRDSPETRRKKSYDSAGEISGTSPSNSPWVQRRLKAAQEQSPLAGNSPGTSPLLARRQAGIRADSVLRDPKGPDGTRGFYDGKGRGKPVSPLAQESSPGT